MSALAEVVWTPASARDYADFRARLETHLRRLKALDVNFRKVDRP
jgi:N-acetyl-beta-hexosaminidase